MSRLTNHCAIAASPYFDLLDEQEVGVKKVSRADWTFLALLPASKVRVFNQIVSKNL